MQANGRYLMKTYQLKVVVKNSKPPIWRRCLIPSGITFSHLAFLLEMITESEICEEYRFYFYKAKSVIFEPEDPGRMKEMYDYDYICAPDTYIDNMMESESRFVFESIDGDIFKVEIEKSFEYDSSTPVIVKQKDQNNEMDWEDLGHLNAFLREECFVKYGEPDHRSLAELIDAFNNGEQGFTRATKPENLTERNVNSIERIWRDLYMKKSAPYMPYVEEILRQLEGETGDVTDSVKAGKIEEIVNRFAEKLFSELKEKKSEASSEKYPYSSKVEDFLQTFNKNELKDMANDFGIKKFSSLSKPELIRKIRERMLDPEVMRARFLLLDDEEIKEFDSAVRKGKGFYADDSTMDNLMWLYSMNYVFMYDDDYVEVPEEVARIYEMINTSEFRKKRFDVSRMNKCLRASAMVYAIAPVRVVKRVLERCLGRTVDIREFHGLFSEVTEEFNPCVMLEDRIISRDVFDNGYYKSIERQQRGKDFYVMKPEEVEEYAINGYPIKDPYYSRLRKFLIHKIGLPSDRTERFLAVIWSEVSAGMPLSEMLNNHEDVLIFPNDEAFVEFGHVMMGVNNNTRMAVNCGHTPNEFAGTEYPELNNLIPFSPFSAGVKKPPLS